MNFKNSAHIICIRGYADDQEPFMRNLLEKSVEHRSLFTVSVSSLKGYIGGNPIWPLAKMMFEANVRPDLIKRALEDLYDCKHKTTKTFNDRFGGKPYKEALFESARVSGLFPNLTHDNLSEALSKCLYTILKVAMNEAESRKQHSDSAENPEQVRNQLVISYILSDDEKKAIKNIGALALSALETVMQNTKKIDEIQHQLRKHAESANELRWEKLLQYELAQLKSDFESRYSKLISSCSDLIAVIDNKKHLHPSMENLSKIAHMLVDNEDKFKITSASFSYNMLSVRISDFCKHYKLLMQDWGMQ